MIADAYPLFLDALERLFTNEPGFNVLACCRHCDEVSAVLADCEPDVLLLDLEIPQALQILCQHAERGSQTRIILLAAHLNEHQMLDAMRLGAKGILLKTMTRELLIQCVRKVHGGAIWLERVTTAKAVNRLLRAGTESSQAAASLTRRELEIVRMATAGRSSKDIGKKLSISEATVKVHLHHVYEKLGVKGRLQLTLYARDTGLLSPLLNAVGSEV